MPPLLLNCLSLALLESRFFSLVYFLQYILTNRNGSMYVWNYMIFTLGTLSTSHYSWVIVTNGLYSTSMPSIVLKQNRAYSRILPKNERWQIHALINHCVFCAAKRLQYATDPEEKASATTFYKRLAAMLIEKPDTGYSLTINLIRCKLSFALLRASIMSIRGARSSRHRAASEPYQEGPIDFQTMEGRI